MVELVQLLNKRFELQFIHNMLWHQFIGKRLEPNNTYYVQVPPNLRMLGYGTRFTVKLNPFQNILNVYTVKGNISFEWKNNAEVEINATFKANGSSF